MSDERFQIITFYEFKPLDAERLPELRGLLRDAMRENSIRGTIIIATEGCNSTVCGAPADINRFVAVAEEVLDTTLNYKSSFHDQCPFRKIDVKIKPEIVTLKQPVNLELGAGTHVSPREWNDLISDPNVVVLDTRNDYEVRSGTFRRAVNPGTEKFSELPAFVAENFDPKDEPKIAMFCTGGIRCEKFAPYMKQLGFSHVYQLEGGILRYLEQTPAAESLWEGECFVFDERVTVDENLEKGVGPDFSLPPKSVE